MVFCPLRAIQASFTPFGCEARELKPSVFENIGLEFFQRSPSSYFVELFIFDYSPPDR